MVRRAALGDLVQLARLEDPLGVGRTREDWRRLVLHELVMVGIECGGVLAAVVGVREAGALVVSVLLWPRTGVTRAWREGLLRAFVAAAPEGVPLVRHCGPKSEAWRWAAFPEIRAVARGPAS